MNIDDFKKRKKIMELEIQKATQMAVDSFYDDTKYSPHTINIYTTETTNHGEKRRFMITACDSLVEI